MKQILGALMVLIPFIGFFVFVYKVEGFKVAFLVFSSVAVGTYLIQ